MLRIKCLCKLHGNYKEKLVLDIQNKKESMHKTKS